ncbi:MAG TPA: hypothetical protein VKE94_21660 [Gemmataceae bacterium]|nr:hypothetical protein [Gemmataceae bacterium]
MPLPVPANTTCDIYRNGHSPPAAPDVAAVPIQLQHAVHHEKWKASQGQQFSAQEVYQYVALVPLGTDIRDNSNGAAAQDTIYVPDKNGVAYTVVWVERVSLATGEILRAFLTRNTTTFPTVNI